MLKNEGATVAIDEPVEDGDDAEEESPNPLPPVGQCPHDDTDPVTGQCTECGAILKKMNGYG